MGLYHRKIPSMGGVEDRQTVPSVPLKPGHQQQVWHQLLPSPAPMLALTCCHYYSPATEPRGLRCQHLTFLPRIRGKARGGGQNVALLCPGLHSSLCICHSPAFAPNLGTTEEPWRSHGGAMEDRLPPAQLSAELGTEGR